MLEGAEDDETYPALEPAIAAAAFWAVKICQRTFFPMYSSLRIVPQTLPHSSVPCEKVPQLTLGLNLGRHFWA